MGLDPNIILQGQQYDPMQSIGKAVQLSSLMRQGELQGLQADQARQEMQDTITLRNLYKQHASDPAALLQGVRGAGLYKQADELEKSGLERQKLATDRDKTLGEIDKNKAETLLRHLEYTKSAMTGVIADPSDANIAQALGGFVQNGVMTQEQAQAEYQKVAGMPLAARKQYLMFHAAKQDQAISMLTPKLEALDLGGSRQIVDMNGFTNPGAVGQSIKKTVTPDAQLSASTAIRGQNMTDARAREGLGIQVDMKKIALQKAQHEQADRVQAKGAQLSAADDALSVLNKAINHPGRLAATGVSSYLGGGIIPGTEGRNFSAVVDQIKGVAFLQAFSNLKGGGQITEIEGKKATDAIARLDTAQSEGEFLQSLKDLKAVMEAGRKRLSAGAGATATDPGNSPSATASVAPASLPFADGARVSSGRISPPAPKAGASEDGYIFLGGDPADPKRWKKASAK